MLPMARSPCPVTGGRKVPVCRDFYISPVVFGPFRCYPYMVVGRPRRPLDNCFVRPLFDINMLGSGAPRT